MFFLFDALFEFFDEFLLLDEFSLEFFPEFLLMDFLGSFWFLLGDEYLEGFGVAVGWLVGDCLVALKGERKDIDDSIIFFHDHWMSVLLLE